MTSFYENEPWKQGHSDVHEIAYCTPDICMDANEKSYDLRVREGHRDAPSLLGDGAEVNQSQEASYP